MCGIYKITNIINGKCYIGQSINIQERWRRHRCFNQDKSHYPLYLAFAEYGLDNFTFEILEECGLDELNEKEQFYIKKYDSYKTGYNQTIGGQGTGHIVKLSDEDVEIIYDLLQNSSILQNDIARMFNIGTDTVSEINQGKTRIKEGYSYPLRNNRSKQFFCIECGKQISHGATRCADCEQKARRIVQRPSRDNLKSLIRSKSFVSIGKMFGVSDNAIRKWCDAEGLPRKTSEIKKISDKDWAMI